MTYFCEIVTMKGGFVLLILSYVVYAKALECGILKLNNDQFRKVMTECVKDNHTLDKIWDMTSSDETEEDSSTSSKEVVPITRGMINNGRVAQAKRMKRSRGSRFNNDSPMSNVQRKYGGMSSTTEESTTIVENQSEENTNINIIGDSEDMCVLQCVFEKLEMTDSNGLPDHKKFADALLKSTSGRELRDFVQESTDECFQQMDPADSENSCKYSSKLVTCLADQGKSNCEDWPSGDIPML